MLMASIGWTGSFIPIMLEQLARERGVLLHDRSKSCKTSFGIQNSHSAKGWSQQTRKPHGDSGQQCVFSFLGTEMNTASFAMYTFSLSVLIQAILIISMSGAAGHGRYRKLLLLAFAFIGASATALFVFVTPNVYVLGALLAIVSNTCFGASFVLLNSFLPLLVRHHSTIQRSQESENRSDHGSYTDVGNEPLTAPLLPSGATAPSFEKTVDASPELRLSTQISSNGIGIGYIAAVVVQALAIGIIIVTRYNSKSTTLGLRLVLLFIGLWWLAFTIPAALWLRPRPGPPIPFTSKGQQRRSWIAYIVYAWTSLGKTALRARHLKDMLLFLSAWFLLSDGIATVSGTAVLFAKTQLEMGPAALAAINIVVTISGVIGAFSWATISRKLQLSPARTIIACICLFELIPLYGLLGFIPAIKRLGVFGLQQYWEMYPLGAVYGLVLGGLSSYCRSLFGELIPPGFEAAFYALYAITDKGSSIFGPAIVGAITDRYGEIRPAFLFLAVLIAVPLPLMMCVDVERGRRDGGRMAAELEGKKRMGAGVGRGDGTILFVDEEAEQEDEEEQEEGEGGEGGRGEGGRWHRSM